MNARTFRIPVGPSTGPKLMIRMPKMITPHRNSPYRWAILNFFAPGTK